VAEIKTVAVIGAGPLGRGIAHRAALAGYRTILEDILPASLRKSEAEIRSLLDQSLNSGTVAPQAADAALARLEYAGSVEEAARPADLVIEAVPDEMDSKLEIFTLLDRICKPHTILASTTSSLSVTEIASITYRARKILGLRFSCSVAHARAVDLVCGRDTDEETIQTGADLARRMGVEVRIVRSSNANQPLISDHDS
jgi:3-hydroxybutyryl-CoA dehydrogenase